MHRKVILYIATSIDGYIAAPNDDLSFLDLVQEAGQDYGYYDFEKQVDTIIMGRKTYDWVVQAVGHFPHKDKPTFIVTRTPKPKESNVQFYSGDLEQLIETLRTQNGKHIFLDGGASVVQEFLRSDLIDEMILSIIPRLLGAGVRLFDTDHQAHAWELVSSRAFPKGLVQNHYKRVR